MSGEAGVTVIGILTAYPALRFTGSGTAVACFAIASTPRTFDARAWKGSDGDTVFVAATAWRGTVEHGPRP